MPSEHDPSDLIFAPEEAESIHYGAVEPWKLLIVDDEPSVHDVTLLALENFIFDGRPIRFLHATSRQEAEIVLTSTPDIAVALVDVVMESEHAGLDLVRWIRQVHGDPLMRIVLRTGQPGQAPEREVIQNYDINDYKEKTELSSQKLFSTVYTSLRSYRDLVALDANRRGLERVIRASAEVFRNSMLQDFIRGVLEQLVALLYLDADSMYVHCDSLAVERSGERLHILAGTGQFAAMSGQDARSALAAPVLEPLLKALETHESIALDGAYVGYFRVSEKREGLLYITSSHAFSQDNLSLLKLFCQNVSIAYDNTLLREEIEGTQRDMVLMLGEAIETRSHETGRHVQRVAEYCFLIAQGMGLSAREAEVLRAAAPLHDLGKVGIPDHILHKPGKLDAEEWAEMRTHAEIGAALLSRSSREVLQAAAIIAAQHHEKWDGSGYPNGLSGTNIHFYGRISAVADVFDALGSQRSYKSPWPIEQVFAYLAAERARHFDPAIVDWILAHREEMLAVRNRLPD